MSDDVAARILRRDAEEIADRVYAEFGCEAGCGMDGIVKIVEEVLGRFPGRAEIYRDIDLDAAILRIVDAEIARRDLISTDSARCWIQGEINTAMRIVQNSARGRT